MGRPSAVEAPVSTVTGTGMGLWLSDVETVVREGAGGHTETSYVGKIWDLATDRSGNVWVATEAGLSRFDGQHWTTFTEAGYPICAVAVDDQDQVWAGEFGPALSVRWAVLDRLPVEERGHHHAVAPNGQVWCTGSSGYLFARFDGQECWTYDPADIGIDASENRFDHLHVSEIAVDQSGMLWAVAHFWQVLDEVGG